jgi:hypothetical protein
VGRADSTPLPLRARELVVAANPAVAPEGEARGRERSGRRGGRGQPRTPYFL